MKKKILAFLLAACLAMIPETAMEAQAAGEQGTDYRAPAYGTKAVAAEKQALYEEIEKAYGGAAADGRYSSAVHLCPQCESG